VRIVWRKVGVVWVGVQRGDCVSFLVMI